MKIFLSTPPSTAKEASSRGEASLMAYRMGAGFHLYGVPIPDGRFALMEIDCAGFNGRGPQELLSLEVARECARRGYSGVALDIPSAPTRPLVGFCRTLEGALGRAGLRLLVPGPFGRYTGSAGVIFQDAPERGAFRDRLRHLASRYGAERVYVALERVYRDYAVPAGSGRVLEAQRAKALISAGKKHYSAALIANYVSYSENGRAHILFWDDAATLKSKLAVLRDERTAGAFLYYPHVRNILGDIL